MISKFINSQKSIRKKLLTIIIGVTTCSLLMATIIKSVTTYLAYGFQDNFYWDIIIDVSIIGLSMITAYFLSLKLQSIITRPLFHLSGLAVTLAEKQDYTLRATKFSDDEVGLLAEAFNEMIIGMDLNKQELEKAQQDADNANSQKGDFLAMMSHEIRTPLNGIIGTTDLLTETHLTGRQKQYVDVIEKSADILFDLINDILDFSKIEANKMELETIDFDLTQHIHDVIDMLEISVKQKGLDLLFSNKIKQHCYVTGDPIRIKQILINLVSNAIKFTSTGAITITLDEGSQIDNDNLIQQIWISVTDTGIGIPSDRQNLIFDSFSQADSTTTRKFGGSGLGLSICRRLVEMMNGTIGVQSVESKGSTFWFSLALPIAKAPKLTPIINTQTRKNTDKRSVMLVEDNETNIMITSEILFQNGYEVTLCRDGEEALNSYKQFMPKYILMDCFMPKMDGWEATQKIRAFEKNHKLPPATIIALTANAMGEDREKCLAAGMDEFISKPFKKQELLDKLDTIFG